MLFLEKYGTVKDAWSVDNLIVNLGKATIAGLVGNTGSQTAFTYLALGTSTTAVAAAQTALQAETVVSGLARAAAAVARTTTNVANDTLTLTKTFTSGGSATIEEIGVFNASSSGVMLGRALTTSKILTSGDTIACTYNVIFT